MELRYETLWLWAPDFQRPAVIGAKIGRTLDAFTRIDPLLGRWTTGHPTKLVGPALDPMEIDRTLLVEEGVWLDDWGRPDPEQGGYHWWSWTGGTDLATVATPRTATFQVKAGSKFRNFCVFAIGGGFPKPSDLGVVTYPLYRSVMLATLSIWPAAWACAKCSAAGMSPAQVSEDPSFPNSQYRLPWIAYLCAERLKGLELPPDVLTEPTLDGGLLMIAAEERLDPDNPAHMARSKLIAEIMIERGGNPGY